MEPKGTDGTRQADWPVFADAGKQPAEPEQRDLPPQALRYVELVSEVPAVRHVAFAWDGAALRLWAVTDTYDFDANDAIFTRELELYDKWPGAEYDFFVLVLAGRPVESAVPEDFRIIWSAPGR